MRSDACRAARWSTSEAPSVPHGGFVLGAELLDSSAFGLSEAEASAMDPQQRLVLELGYDALHGAAEAQQLLVVVAVRDELEADGQALGAGRALGRADARLGHAARDA